MAAGRDTAADAILTLAGARNVADGFTGYKPLTAEAALVLQPDVILIADYAMKLLGGPQAVRARPEIALTPAGRTGPHRADRHPVAAGDLGRACRRR